MTYEDQSNWKEIKVPSQKDIDSYPDKYLLKTKELLSVRGLKNSQLENFFSPEISSIPDYTKLFDSEGAAKEIIEHAQSGKTIYIHGDFDADGICATSLLWSFLYRELSSAIGEKVNVMPYIPSRGEEGYGLSEGSMKKLVEKNAQVVITVDCGIRDRELIEKYKSQEDIDFIITDHHQPPDDFKSDHPYTIVHPMYPGKEYPLDEISGAFVVLLLIQAIRAELKLDWKFTDESVGLDLTALSTVADMMPLLSHNRTMVKKGLEQINEYKTYGLNVLLDVASLRDVEIDAYHLGFVIGPRINVAGRLGNSLDAVRLLATRDAKKARDEAIRLDQLNKDRQKITEKALEEAQSQIDQAEKVIIVKSDSWQEGIIGLIAGKIMEKYKKPTIAITTIDEIKGSARSLDGYNITDALERNSASLVKYGGHAQAAGFTVKEDALEKFITDMHEDANQHIEDGGLINELKYDLTLTGDELSIRLVEEINGFKPFGMKNKRPLFFMEKVVVMDKFIMGRDKNHMKLRVKSGLERVDSIMFDCLEDIEKINEDDLLDLIGYPDLNTWNGQTNIQFMIKAWRKSTLKE